MKTPTRKPKLDAATLRSVAKEMRASSKTNDRMARKYASRGFYAAAHGWSEIAWSLNVWAEHFEGQARAAVKR